jgi:uncharacterized membrane protein YcaP (DUF421 family)
LVKPVERLVSTIEWIFGLGLESSELGTLRMGARAAFMFVLSVVMLRIGDKRFMGRNTILDVMLGIVFGSVVSRAITGNAPFFPTLGAAFVLVAMHFLMSAVAFRSHRFGNFAKGKKRLLVREGEIQWDEMKRSHVTEHDLKQALRANGSNADIAKIDTAYLERNGDISIIERRAVRETG